SCSRVRQLTIAARRLNPFFNAAPVKKTSPSRASSNWIFQEVAFASTEARERWRSCEGPRSDRRGETPDRPDGASFRPQGSGRRLGRVRVDRNSIRPRRADSDRNRRLDCARFAGRGGARVTTRGGGLPPDKVCTHTGGDPLVRTEGGRQC